MALVRVRLFAALREIAGAPNVEAEGDTVGEVIDALAARYGERFEAIARAGSAVVDAERAEPSRPITDGEEVALLPPVSGGCRRRPGDFREPSAP
jgi:MoaD family protein